MNRWSNRFVSLSSLILLAACHSTPREDSQAPALYVVKPAGDGTVNAMTAVPSTAAPNAAAPNTAAPRAAAPQAAAANQAAPGNGVVPDGTAARGAGTAPAKGSPASPPPTANAPAGSISASGNAPPAITAPVPAQAAQQYAEALKLMKAGQATDAELGFKQLASTYPDFPGPQLNLGLLYLQGSRLPDAEATFKAVLERNPSNAIAGNELGIVERRLGKFTEAEAAYQRTIAAEPNYAPAYLNLGVLYDLYLAEPQKALEQFEHYIQLAGENKQVAGWVVELRKRVGAPAPAAKKEPA